MLSSFKYNKQLLIIFLKKCDVDSKAYFRELIIMFLIVCSMFFGDKGFHHRWLTLTCWGMDHIIIDYIYYFDVTFFIHIIYYYLMILLF